ncbi:MAG TPA: hypothetical protein VHS09_15670, partial [Polyangiaceae bacterium]|nr:hypothetical protein [Polyangiaceae bacterium]
MRRILAAMVAALLLATVDASAQPYLRQQPPSPQATPNQIAAQSGVDSAALLLLYMRQLASTGQPVSQTDIDEAARQYFTNGAAVSTVPTSGPGAAYFQNGAAAVGYGASPAPTVAGQATATPPAAVAPAAPSPYGAAVPVPQAVPEPVPVPAPASPPSETSATTSSESAATTGPSNGGGV